MLEEKSSPVSDLTYQRMHQQLSYHVESCSMSASSSAAVPTCCSVCVDVNHVKHVKHVRQRRHSTKTPNEIKLYVTLKNDFCPKCSLPMPKNEHDDEDVGSSNRHKHPYKFSRPLHRMAQRVKQFVESINPLSGFDGKESLETYLWSKSLKAEPKDPDKMEIVKPLRPPHVLKSPGIKQPKTVSSASTCGQANHYSGYRSSGKGFATFNTYSPSISEGTTHLSNPQSPSFVDERNSHLGVIEINPGRQPRYLGDAVRGFQSTLNSPTEQRAPPLVPRQRKDKASSTPPSPHNSSHSQSDVGPPPLFPRKTCTLSSHPPRCPPPPLRPFNSLNIPAPPHSAPFASQQASEGANSFVFPPHTALGLTRSIAHGNPLTKMASVPAVPPRKRTEQLPSPLSEDTVRVLWNEELQPQTVSATSLSPSTTESEPPRLYPRRTTLQLEPPPRPPKKIHSASIQPSSVQLSATEEDGTKSPPPLPPKTYRSKYDR